MMCAVNDLMSSYKCQAITGNYFQSAEQSAAHYQDLYNFTKKT